MLKADQSAIAARKPFCVAAVTMLVALSNVATAQVSFDAQVHIDKSIPHDYYRELYEVTAATQELLNTLGRFERIDPNFILVLNDQLNSIPYMSSDEISKFAAAGTLASLTDMHRQIQQLNTLLREQANAMPKSMDFANSAAFGVWTDDCPDGQRYDSNPPGPCLQESGGIQLSDSGYPLLCPISSPPVLLLSAQFVLSVAEFVASFTEKFCYQSAFGANTSTACVVTDIIGLVAERTFVFFSGCNAKRGDSEAFVTYARAGEIFAAARENFSSQDTSMQISLDDVVAAERALLEKVAQARAKMESSLDDGFTSTETRLMELQTQAIQNSQRLDHVLSGQRAIMQQLGIEYLYEDPNTNAAGASANQYQTTDTKAKGPANQILLRRDGAKKALQ